MEHTGIPVRDKGFYRLVFGMAFPLTLQFLMQISVNTANSIMLGRTSELQMATAAQAAQVFFLFSAITFGFATPGAMLISQYWGRKNLPCIRSLMTMSLRCNMMFGASVALAVFTFPGAIMRCFSSDPALIAEGAAYLRIAAVGYLPYAVSNTLYQSFRAVERARIIGISNFVFCGLNILLNYCFIFGRLGLPAFGVRGAAMGMAVARLVEMTLMLCYLLRVDMRVRYRVHHFIHFDAPHGNAAGAVCAETPGEAPPRALLWRDYRKVLRPVLGHEIIWGFGMTASQAIMGQISTSAIAAFSICYVLYELVTAPMNGLAGAASTVIGKTVGAGEKTAVRGKAYTLMGIATLFGLAGALVMLLFGGRFAGLYALSAQSRGYVGGIMTVMAVAAFFTGWEVVGLVGVLRGGGDAKTGFFTDVVAMWVVAIPLGLMAAFWWHLPPVLVILLLKLDMPLKGTVAMVRILRMRWVNDMTRAPAVAPQQGIEEIV